MPFFKEFYPEIKTFVLVDGLVIFVLIATAVFLLRETTPPFVQPADVVTSDERETKRQKHSVGIEPNEELIERLKEKILQNEYAQQITHHFVRKRDITGDGVSELIIVQLPREEEQGYSYPLLDIVEILNTEGDYREIAVFDFQDIDVRYWESPIVNAVGDLNLDGRVEIHVSGNVGSVRPSSQDIFLVFDPASLTLTEMEIINKNGEKVPSHRIFLGGARGGGSGGIYVYSLKIGDVDGDGRLEIIQLYEDGPPWAPFDDGEVLLYFDRWRTEIYEWNGFFYGYSAELSSSGEGVFQTPSEWQNMYSIDLINGTDRNVDIPLIFIITSTPPSVGELDFDQILSTFRFAE